MASIHCPQGDLWRQTMQYPCGEYTERAASDDFELEFWQRFLENKQTYQPDSYAAKIADVVCDVIHTQSGVKSIVELGPGWGNYTFRLAELCDTLTCVDISADILGYIQKIADDKGITNIKTAASKWEEYNHPPCDVFFGYNCFYRMKEIEQCLMKMYKCAKKLCIIGMSGCPEQPYLRDFDDVGLAVRYTRMNHRNLYEILKELGIHAEFIEIPNEREYVYDCYDALFSRATEYICGSYDESVVKDILGRYYVSNNGVYRCHYHFKSGLLIWRPQY